MRHPDRSAAKWRDLLFSGIASEANKEKAQGKAQAPPIEAPALLLDIKQP
jgi:hypothetical protein